MTMSIGMSQGLTSLLSINSEMAKYQVQATSGKKINSAADGLASYITARGFNDRSSRLSTVNDGISTALTSIKSAKTGLDSINKLLADTRATLKAASETQAKQVATGVTQGADTDPNNTQFGFTFGLKNGAANGGGNVANQTVDTALVVDDKGVAANNVYATLGGQRLTHGTTFTFSAGGKTVDIKIGRTSTANGAETVGTDSDTSVTVHTIGEFQTALREKLGIDSALTNTANGLQFSATFNGASFGRDGFGGTDLASKKGVAVALKAVGTAGASNGTLGVPVGTFDFAAGYNINNLLTNTRAANNNKVTYIEDVKLNSATPAAGTNSAVGDSSTIYGVQHNFKAATDARDADVSRANAAKAFRSAMNTLNQYVRDSVSSGVNLLTGDALRVTLNEKGASQLVQLTTAGGAVLTISASSLGLVDSVGNSPDVTYNNFAQNYENGNAGVGLLNAIDKLDTSINTISFAQSQVASATSIISDRKDFNAGLISLLNQSANDLEAADLTDVGTKLSALQVQQSFAQAILSNTKQSDQSLIQLLR